VEAHDNPVTVEEKMEIIMGATPSSMNAGSTQAPSGIIRVVPSEAALA
jgi:hypothetical protein